MRINLHLTYFQYVLLLIEYLEVSQKVTTNWGNFDNLLFQSRENVILKPGKFCFKVEQVF